jgi:hypothetical protein
MLNKIAWHLSLLVQEGKKKQKKETGKKVEVQSNGYQKERP